MDLLAAHLRHVGSNIDESGVDLSEVTVASAPESRGRRDVGAPAADDGTPRHV
jgi:hypothetical protein